MGYFIIAIILFALALVALAALLAGNARLRKAVEAEEAVRDCLLQEQAFQRHEAQLLQEEVDRLAFSWHYQEQAEKEAEAWVNQAKWAWVMYDLKASYEAQLEALSANLHWINQSTWAYLAQVVGQPKGGQDVFGRWYNPRTGEWKL